MSYSLRHQGSGESNAGDYVSADEMSLGGSESEDDEDITEVESLDSWDGDDEDEYENEYYRLLQALSEKWLLVELDHTVSKAASNEFWRLATSLIPQLFETKTRLGISRKTPQFVHVRRKLHQKFLPKIHHSTAYQHEDTGEIISVPDTEDIHRNDSSFSKVFETASVSVITKTA